MQPGILVIDDDPALLSLLRLALQRQGFAVWTANSGLAALEVYSHEREGIDLVLLDVRMPALDGPQTLAELRRLNHDVVCCFMSGHTAKYAPSDLLDMGALHFFDKPFRLDEIVPVLWEIAQRPRAE